MTENSLQIFNQKNNEIFQDNRNNKNPNQNLISNNINCTNAIQILISELDFIFFYVHNYAYNLCNPRISQCKNI